MEKVLMKGNEAIAEAAIKAGCTHFFGYPITPQNQIPEYMSRRMPKTGGTFIQAESEVSAINMVYGAAGMGARVMTSSSSPGISLKQEGISYIACAQLPCVIVNMVRGGPGLGSIQASQADYFQATKGGGHGDYRLITYAPSSVQEAAELVAAGFDVAEIYRNPVMILGDGVIGQMMEPVDFSSLPKRSVPEKSWAATGKGKGNGRAIINSLYMKPEELSEVNGELQKKYKYIEENEALAEEFMTEDAQYIMTAFGTTARIVKNVVIRLREMGEKVGLIRPITVWPFPTKIYEKCDSYVKGFLTVEMNAGQMKEDIERTVGRAKAKYFYGVQGGIIPGSDNIEKAYFDMKEDIEK